MSPHSWTFLHLSPPPTPLDCHRAPIWIPWVIQQVPVAICFTYGIVSFHVTLSIYLPPSLPNSPVSMVCSLCRFLHPVIQSCPTLCDPMDCSMPGFPVHHQLPELAQTHVHRVSDAIQPSYPLSSPSLPAFNLSQHRCLFQWVSSSHQLAKILKLQLQPQSFQWIYRNDFL